MSVHELSRTEARRIAVRAQLLTAERPAGLLTMVQHLTLLQINPTNAIAPSADLVAWSRLGSSYSTAELEDALDGRALIDYQLMIRPSEDLALYRAEMDEYRRGLRGYQEVIDWVRANDACRRDILDRLAESGPTAARDIPDTCAVPWKSSGWSNNRNVMRMVECMERRGEVAVAGRKGGDRLWDLAERIYPDDPVVSVAEAVRMRNELRLRALGLARAKTTAYPGEPADVGEVGEPAVIDGVKGTWRVEPSLLDQPFAGRAALLSPLDRLVYDRRRTLEIFEFDYQLEQYKPARSRRWGYFALPILYGDRLVGKLDATADRRAGVLRVAAIHDDVPFDDDMTEAVTGQIQDLARWLELDLSLPR